MTRFLGLMDTFLADQRDMMLTTLGGRSAPPATAAPRFVPVVREAGPPAGPALNGAGDVVGIAGDAGGGAAALATCLADRGVRTVLVTGTATPVTALVDLRPLDAPGDVLADDVRRSRARVGGLVNGLMDLCRDAGPGLRAVIAATAMGGTFGVDAGPGAALDPAHGAVAGLVKAVGAEWGHVAAKVVDFEAATAPAAIASAILAELLAHDGRAEIGRPPGRRVTIAVEAAPPAVLVRTALGPDAVVLLTGGARGITAVVARALAERYRATLVLVGRTAPDGDDARAAETRATLDAISAAGGRAEYHRADAGDPDALARVVDEIYSRHGRLDGVIHGAGVIDDGALATKTTASVLRVLDPKVTGALTLARRLRWPGLRFLVLFSSVAGHFGNAGQTDYAAANAFLDKLAVDLDRRGDARVLAIAWGPWAGAGMVSDAVARRFAERGIGLVTPEAGCAALIGELERDGPACPELVVGSGPWAADLSPPTPAQAPSPASRPHDPLALAQAGPPTVRPDEPLLTAPARAEDGTVSARIAFDAENDPLLADHRLDGRSVLPAAVALELLAETAAIALEPPPDAIRLEDFRLLRGVTADGPELALRTRAHADGAQRVAVELCSAEGRLVHYRARAGRGHAPVDGVPDPLAPTGPFALTIAEIYDRWLWHGPALQAIASIDAHAPEGLDATLRAGPPPSGRWRIDPVALDAVFQLGIVWSRHTLRRTALPARIGRIEGRLAVAPGTPIRCRLRLRSQPGGALLTGSAALLDDGRRPLAVLDGIELSCSAELNRLGTGHVAEAVR
jgi:NAD(P)-dependent dehydrogenase (short-subunit alcohol dehydrogenase family)